MSDTTLKQFIYLEFGFSVYQIEILEANLNNNGEADYIVFKACDVVYKIWCSSTILCTWEIEIVRVG